MRNRPLAAALLAATAISGATAGAAPPRTPYGATDRAQLPPPPPAPPAAPAPRVRQVPRGRAEGVLGQPVVNAKGDTIGHVVDILIDRRGRPKAAVVDFEGFFGVGDRKIAVAWDAMRFDVTGGKIVITVTLDAAKLKALPVYSAAAPSVPVAAKPRAPAP